MKLSLLHEAVTTGAIAVGPMVALPIRSKKKRKRGKKIEEVDAGANRASGYLGISGSKQPTNKMTTVWTTFKSPKGSSWEQKYAATHDPDERLLKPYRGKGY
jgi:hypothetical protein